jgi:hypothetical protein
MSRITCFVSGKWPTHDGNGLKAMMATITSGATAYHLYEDNIAEVVKSYSDIRIVGHSFGGCATVDACGWLKREGRLVSRVVLLDAVPYSWNTNGKFKLPDNVKAALAIKKPGGLPPSCGLVNHDFKTTIVHADHGNFPRNHDVVSQTLAFLADEPVAS